jgi:integrase
LVVRPRPEDVEWTILTPPQVAAVAEAFSSLARQARDDEARQWLVQARVIFVVVTTLGLRRGEVRGLHWRNVDLADPEGAVVRVAETFVRGGVDTPKSRAGRRTIPLGPVIAEQLWQHWRRTAFKGSDEYVFCSPSKGTPFDVGRYAESLTKALSLAGVEARVRPFHDGRHTSITNDAAAGSTPMGMMRRAGHANFATTQGYINLAGVSFREEAVEAEARLLRGLSVQESGTKLALQADPVEARRS